MAPNSKKPIGTSTHTVDLKQRVLTCLDKLSDRDTYSQAATELDLTARSLSSSTTLTPFLTCLFSLNNSSTSHKPTAVAYSLRLISTLASIHGGSLSPHLPLILSSSILPNLRHSSSLVRSACVDAVSSLSRHLINTPFRLFLDPLLSAMCTDQDPTCAAKCLSAAVDSSGEIFDDPGEVRRALPRMMKLMASDGGGSNRGKAAVLGVIGSVVGSGCVVNEKVLIGSVVGCAVESLGSTDWMVRKSAAEVLEKVAVAMVAMEDREMMSVGEIKRVCVESLEKRRFDKVKIVREAMNKALEVWRDVDDDLCLSRSTPISKLRYSGSNSCGSGGGVGSSVMSKSYDHGQLKKLNCATSSGKFPVSPSSKFKKTLSSSKTRSSLSPISTLSKTRSSLSSSSSSPVSNLSLDPRSNNKKKKSPLSISSSKKKSILNNGVGNSCPAGTSDWKIEIVLRRGGRNEESNDESVMECDDFIYVDGVDRSSWSATASSLVVPSHDDDEDHDDYADGSINDYSEVVDIDGELAIDEQMYDDYGLDSEDHPALMIRKQLIKIEKQQSNLMDLVQSLIGSSHNGITALETRVSGLEKAVDGISYIIRAAGPKFRKSNDARFGGTSKSVADRDVNQADDDDTMERHSDPMKDIPEV